MPAESRMTKEALAELDRRAKAGEDISGLFDLKTGKPIKMTKQLRAVNAELSKLNFE